MAKSIIRFINVVMAGLITGIVIGIWIGFNPKSFSFSTYLELQQGAIRALNTLMPLLGLITIVLTLLAAFLNRHDRLVLIPLLTAAILLFISGLITKFGNQPINAIVMTWNHSEVPSNWTELRDKWWALHKIRSLTSLLSFFLIVWAHQRRD
jgi:hypothetical protein